MSTIKIENNITTAAYEDDYSPTPEYGTLVDASIHFQDSNEKSIQVCIDGNFYFPDQLESLLKSVEKAKQIISLIKEKQRVSQSHGLTAFYREYKSWVKTAENDSPIFESGCGLIRNLRNYCYYCQTPEKGEERFTRLSVELKEQLISEGFDPVHPFGGKSPYMHFNSHLIEWVNKHSD